MTVEDRIAQNEADIHELTYTVNLLVRVALDSGSPHDRHRLLLKMAEQKLNEMGMRQSYPTA